MNYRSRQGAKKIFFVLLIGTIFFIFFPGMIFGQEINGAEGGNASPSPTNTNTATGGGTGVNLQDAYKGFKGTPGELAGSITTLLLGFIGLIAVGMLIVGGAMYMMSAGNQEQIDRAKKILLGAVIGIILAIGAYVIISTVTSIL